MPLSKIKEVPNGWLQRKGPYRILRGAGVSIYLLLSHELGTGSNNTRQNHTGFAIYKWLHSADNLRHPLSQKYNNDTNQK